MFLEGKGSDQSRDEDDPRWRAISSDVGAVAAFFDLMVLHKKLPTFNYTDTFDMGLNFDESLGAVVNVHGDQPIVPIDVKYEAYMTTKGAAIKQLEERLAEGLVVPPGTANDIKLNLEQLGYQWEPSLGSLEVAVPDYNRWLARYLLGHLVFAGYAQQAGMSHVLSPRRSRQVAAVGLTSRSASESAEDDIFRELSARVQDGGQGWRLTELPWTPSFLPWLLGTAGRSDGPDVLLDRARELCHSKAVEKYRQQWAAVGSDPESGEMHASLKAAADEVAAQLGSKQEELQWTKHIFVEVLPDAFGVVGGGAVGFLVAGPIGGIAGGVLGLVGKEVLRPVQQRLWGWFLDELPFLSARKLLGRAAEGERDLGIRLERELNIVWHRRNRPTS